MSKLTRRCFLPLSAGPLQRKSQRGAALDKDAAAHGDNVGDPARVPLAERSLTKPPLVKTSTGGGNGTTGSSSAKRLVVRSSSARGTSGVASTPTKGSDVASPTTASQLSSRYRYQSRITFRGVVPRSLECSRDKADTDTTSTPPMLRASDHLLILDCTLPASLSP